jgi:hypothetical protein
MKFTLAIDAENSVFVTPMANGFQRQGVESPRDLNK